LKIKFEISGGTALKMQWRNKGLRRPGAKSKICAPVNKIRRPL